jgi:hypothetical protein
VAGYSVLVLLHQHCHIDPFVEGPLYNSLPGPVFQPQKVEGFLQAVGFGYRGMSDLVYNQEEPNYHLLILVAQVSYPADSSSPYWTVDSAATTQPVDPLGRLLLREGGQLEESLE